MGNLRYPGGLERLPHNFWANVKFKSRTHEDILNSPADGYKLVERLNTLPGSIIPELWIYEQTSPNTGRKCTATVIRDNYHKMVILHSEDAEIIFRAIERLGHKHKTIKPHKRSQSYSVELQPVPAESVILQRLGGLKGNFSQVMKRLQKLEADRQADIEWKNYIKTRVDALSKEVAEIKTQFSEEFADTKVRIDEVSKKQTLTSSWLRENFSSEWKEAQE